MTGGTFLLALAAHAHARALYSQSGGYWQLFTCACVVQARDGALELLMQKKKIVTPYLVRGSSS